MILTGLGMIIAMVTGNAPADATSITSAIVSITGGIGFIMAKDHNVTGAGSDAITVKK